MSFGSGVILFLLIVGIGSILYWIYLTLKTHCFRDDLLSFLPPPEPSAFKVRTRIDILNLIEKAHERCGWHYTWSGPIDYPGQIVLCWREWDGQQGTDKALDVLLIKDDNTVETLGTDVAFEVFGPPAVEAQEKK